MSVPAGGQQFESINGAIAAAKPGATIRLHAGVYREQVTITKSITLKAAGDGPVWIDAGCDHPNALLIKADSVSIRGIGVRKAQEATIRLEAADNITLDNLTVQDWNCTNEEDQFRAGVASWFGGRKLIVRNSRFERRVDLGGPDAGYGNAVWVKNSSPIGGGGHLIERNTVVGGFDGIGGETESVPWGGFKSDTIIQNNTVTDCSDDGIQVEGGTTRVVVRGNTVRGCLIGIAFAPALTGPLTITRNVIIDPVSHRDQGPAMLKVGAGSIGEVLVYHNSFFGGDGDADGLKQTNRGLTNIRFRNNAIYAGRYVFETDEGLGAMDIDYDAIATSDFNRFAVWSGAQLADFGALLNVTGQEQNGMTTHDFVWDDQLRLLAGSPLIDRGTLIPGINDDYGGSAPDIGAFEFPSPRR
ncbi:MAG: right-handed parallel beta-helix repeat-containing protein [Dehalococcoidia bacterium]